MTQLFKLKTQYCIKNKYHYAYTRACARALMQAYTPSASLLFKGFLKWFFILLLRFGRVEQFQRYTCYTCIRVIVEKNRLIVIAWDSILFVSITWAHVRIAKKTRFWNCPNRLLNNHLSESSPIFFLITYKSRFPAFTTVTTTLSFFLLQIRT